MFGHNFRPVQSDNRSSNPGWVVMTLAFDVMGSIPTMVRDGLSGKAVINAFATMTFNLWSMLNKIMGQFQISRFLPNTEFVGTA